AADMAGVAAGGGSVGIGVLLFAVNVGRTLGATPRLDPVLLAFGCAAGWLVATVAAGVLLATNLHLGWWSLDTLAVLRAHAHAGVGGFFVTLLLGAMFRLVPMFALSGPPDLRRVGTSLALSQAGLVTLTVGLGTTRTAATLGGSALLVTAFFLAGVELRRLVVTRRKRAFEPGLIGFFAGLVCLALSTAVGVSFAIFGGDLPGALAYGVLAALGGVLATVQGMLCKIVPFLVWMRVYGPRVGRQPTPVASALGRPRFERAWVWLHMTATMLLTLGAWSVQRPLLVAGAVLFAIAQAALLTSLAASSRHLWPTVPTPARVAVATQRTS
ncbi:MAG TPA: hypothetical protein VEQ65_12730, partial [Opitutus sp.]|nr:hypothetical protein [Opitutus sp.]